MYGLLNIFEVFARLGDSSFSLVLNEVYESGSLSIKTIRCSSKPEVASAMNDEIYNQALKINFSKLDLVLVCKKSGVVLEKSPVKYAGMTHIYYFCPAYPAPLTGIPFEAVFSRDVLYIAEKQHEEQLASVAKRVFEQ